MASGKLINNYKGYTLQTEWSSVPQLLENKSIITVKHTLIQSKYYDLDIGSRSNSCKIGTDVKSYTSSAICNNGNISVDLGTTVHEIEHETDGSKSCILTDTFNIKATIADTYVDKIVVTGTIELDKIPRQAIITSALSFNDEGVPKIEFNKAGDGYTLKIKIETSDDPNLIVRNNIENTGKYIFELTESERNLLRNKCSNFNELNISYVLETTIKNQIYSSIMDSKMTIINANPTVGEPWYLDTNSETYAVTNDSTKIIRNASFLTAKFYAATAKKGASIEKYELSFNGSVKTVNVVSDVEFETVDVAQDTKLYLKVIDSRGNSITRFCNVSILDYELPIAQINISRVNNFEDSTKIKVDANFSELNNKNVLKIALQFRKHNDFIAINEDWTDSKIVEIGDDLSGQILKLSFQNTTGEFLADETQTIITCEHGSIYYYKTSATGVAEYISVIYNNSETKLYEQYEWNQITNLSTYQLPEGFGKVTAISNTFQAIAGIKFSNSVMLQNNIESTVMCDNKYKWDFHVTLQDKIGSKHYYATIDIGKPITFWDIIKRSFSIGGFPTMENSFELFGVANDFNIKSPYLSSNADDYKYSGLHMFGPNATGLPYSGHWVMFSIGRGDDCVQIAVNVLDANIRYIRSNTGSGFGEWKVLGTNIIDDEKYEAHMSLNGINVGGLRKNLGKLPNNTYATYSTGLTTNYKILDYDLYAVKENQTLKLPFVALNLNDKIAGYLDNANVVNVVTNWNASEYDLWIDIKFA